MGRHSLPVDPLRAPFGAELRKLRVAAGKTQAAIAEALGGVSVPYVHDIEQGHRNPPTLEHMGDIAKLLGIPDQEDRLAELAVEQRGMVQIIPQTTAHRKMLVVLARQIRRGKMSKAMCDKVIRLIDK